MSSLLEAKKGPSFPATVRVNFDTSHQFNTHLQFCFPDVRLDIAQFNKCTSFMLSHTKGGVCFCPTNSSGPPVSRHLRTPSSNCSFLPPRPHNTTTTAKMPITISAHPLPALR